MGVIFQNYYLFEWRTIHQSLMMAAKQNPGLKGKEKEAVQKWAADFGLTDHLHQYPQQLSGGQRQRASIIQQLLKGSDFLLLDEPFSGLDAINQGKLERLRDKRDAKKGKNGKKGKIRKLKRKIRRVNRRLNEAIEH